MSPWLIGVFIAFVIVLSTTLKWKFDSPIPCENCRKGIGGAFSQKKFVVARCDDCGWRVLFCSDECAYTWIKGHHEPFYKTATLLTGETWKQKTWRS